MRLSFSQRVVHGVIDAGFPGLPSLTMTGSASAGPTLDAIKQRGVIKVGVSTFDTQSAGLPEKNGRAWKSKKPDRANCLIGLFDW